MSKYEQNCSDSKWSRVQEFTIHFNFFPLTWLTQALGCNLSKPNSRTFNVINVPLNTFQSFDGSLLKTCLSQYLTKAKDNCLMQKMFLNNSFFETFQLNNQLSNFIKIHPLLQKINGKNSLADESEQFFFQRFFGSNFKSSDNFNVLFFALYFQS